VVDSNLRMASTAQVVVTAREVPTCVITTLDASRAVAEGLEQAA